MSQTFHKTAQLGASMWLGAAFLLLASRFLQPLAWLGIPFYWLALLILGADETQERYGYWGELVLYWLLSLPLTFIYAWLIVRISRASQSQQMQNQT